MTLGALMNKRGILYNSVFNQRAQDIEFESSEDIFYSLGFIVNNCQRFEFEIPEDEIQTYMSYPITEGVTSGGYKMKQARQYRIYFKTTLGMPEKLKERLQDDSHRRMTGSRFIEACYYLGFCAGNKQDTRNIIMNIRSLIQDEVEQRAFEEGLNL